MERPNAGSHLRTHDLLRRYRAVYDRHIEYTEEQVPLPSAQWSVTGRRSYYLVIRLGRQHLPPPLSPAAASVSLSDQLRNAGCGRLGVLSTWQGATLLFFSLLLRAGGRFPWPSRGCAQRPSLRVRLCATCPPVWRCWPQ